MQIRRHWDSFVSILFPPLCASCENVLLHQEAFLCSYCQFHLPVNDHYLFSDNEAMRRIQYQATIEMAAAFLSFSESSLVQTLMHKLKYENELQVGLYLGNEFGRQLLTSPHFNNIDLVVPVPLHPKKKKSRGYNQCDSVAQGIASVLKLPVNTIDFVRLLNNPSQTNMHRMERYDNVENIFSCVHPAAFEGKHVLLVDDVLTTGATIGSAARSLNSAGARVSVAALAMA